MYLVIDRRRPTRSTRRTLLKLVPLRGVQYSSIGRAKAQLTLISFAGQRAIPVYVLSDHVLY